MFSMVIHQILLILHRQYPFDNPREAFAALIDKISCKGTHGIEMNIM